MALKDTWIDRVNGVSDVLAEDPNEIAHAVIKLEESTANALIGEKSGNSITFDDISPLQGTLKVSVESKNLVPTVYHHNKTYVYMGITFTTNDDGSITMNGTYDESGNVSFFLVSSTEKPFVLQKGTYIGSTGQSFAALSCMTISGKYDGFDTPYTLEEETKFRYLYINMQKKNITGKTFNGETLYPMLMRGTTCEAYTEPKENGTAVGVVHGGDTITSAVGETIEVAGVNQGSSVAAEDEGVTLYAEYNKDINKAFAELQQAIISLGGNI